MSLCSTILRSSATSLIALFIFKERITKRLWSAIILITLASMILSMENTNSFSFSIGSIFVLLACTCWGLENNFTRKLSIKDPLQVVVIKGFGSGTGSLLIALAIHERVSNWLYIFAALLLGFLAYGMSIFFYIYAQRYLGAAKTSAYYAIAPFIGAGLSLLIFRDVPTLTCPRAHRPELGSRPEPGVLRRLRAHGDRPLP